MEIPALDVRFVVTDDLVGHRFATAQFLQFDGCAENAAAVRIEMRRVDDLGIGELGLQFDDAALDETLPLLGCVVLGIL
jgi:hypothetical protein